MSKHLLFVYADPGTHVSTEAFNEWYDGEHAPARLTVPGFTSAVRYKTSDSNKPGWLALYDIDSPDVLTSDAYKAVQDNASETEREILSKAEIVHRRIYAPILDSGPVAKPGKYLWVLGMNVKPEEVEDFNRWYAEEHTDLVSKVPGWVRTRRYQLLDHGDRSGKYGEENAPLPYITLHEYDTVDFPEKPELEETSKTPWAVKAFSSVVGFEARTLEVHKVF